MEFLTFLLDRLHEELKLGQESLPIPFNRDDEFVVGSPPQVEDEWEEVGRGGAINHVDQVSRRNAVMLNNSTIISSIFHGTLRSDLPLALLCLNTLLSRSEVKYPNKKASSVSFQRFHCLSLDLSSTSSLNTSLNLRDAMEMYFREEVVESDN